MMQMLAAGGMPLLWALPPKRTRRVLFMQRPLEEVLRSQTVMIQRKGTSGAKLDGPAMIAALEAHLQQVAAWLGKQSHIQVCQVDYQELLEHPRREAERIRRFLGHALEIESMAQPVDRSLYRPRGNS
jgi:hypothetical protein